MRKKKWQKFTETGKVEDYLQFKKISKNDVEFSEENLIKGGKNERTQGNNR